MPIETTKQVTATSPLSEQERIAKLKDVAAARLSGAAYQPMDVVRIKDAGVVQRAMLLGDAGVVLGVMGHRPLDQQTTSVLVHNVDGMELALDLMPAQLEPFA